MTRLLERPLVPVASVEDAERTRRALVPFLAEVDSLVSLHVVEEAGGPSTPDAAEQREAIADEIQQVLQGLPEDADVALTVETRTVHGGDPVARILGAADEAEATAIAFTPRPGGRIVRFVSGNMTGKLVTNGRHPVVTLPAREER
ncbi:MAG: universal stress protein [Haloferacaceae archaeon]